MSELYRVVQSRSSLNFSSQNSYPFKPSKLTEHGKSLIKDLVQATSLKRAHAFLTGNKL